MLPDVADEGIGGSIPACAGAPALWMRFPVPGLSPRVRGHLVAAPVVAARDRSILACAGAPVRWATTWDEAAVYPRVCGGTGVDHRGAMGLWGLSPRVRGHRWAGTPWPPWRRSIPACAGAPRRSAGLTSSTTVYPRVCGGTPRSGGRGTGTNGLSPRVRGHPVYGDMVVTAPGSIPACAGAPS